jgi:hypothetical protein
MFVAQIVGWLVITAGVAAAESVASLYVCQRYDIEFFYSLLIVALLAFAVSQLFFWARFNLDDAPAVNYICFLLAMTSFLAISQPSLALYQGFADEAQQATPPSIAGLSMSVHRYLQLYCTPTTRPSGVDGETMRKACDLAELINDYISKNSQNIELASISRLSDELIKADPHLFWTPYDSRDFDAEPAAIRDMQNVAARLALLRDLLTYPPLYKKAADDVAWVRALDRPFPKIYLSWVLLNVTFMKLGLILAQKRGTDK